MIKVMIVDDEPYIRQGLKILINWEDHGYKICGEASNGQEAFELLDQDDYDLVITDLKMPQMDGIELIEHTQNNISKRIKFIILSGYYEFDYAKKAIQYGVSNYVLKPVKKEELIKVLKSHRDEYFIEKEKIKKIEDSEKIILYQYISQLLSGDYNEKCINYIKSYFRDIKNVRYIHIGIDSNIEETYELQKQLYEGLKDLFSDWWYHIFIPSELTNNNSVALIYVNAFSEDKNMDEKDFILYMYKELLSRLHFEIKFYLGEKVHHIENLSKSYKTAIATKNFYKYNNFKIAYYDDIKDDVEISKYPLDREILDDLIEAIELNDRGKMEKHIDAVWEHFKEFTYEPNVIKMNLDYFLVHLLNLAGEIDTQLEREDIERMITQEDYEQIVIRGNIEYFKKFILEFSDYINSLRKNTFGGILTNVINEINVNYMDNLTLKSLGKKYYVNSAYLGQIFKKNFGCSFKDYLNNYRIERATELLRRTDDKIYEIAFAVGFNSTDYFISKFVQLKGKTPLQYRKKFVDARG